MHAQESNAALVYSQLSLHQCLYDRLTQQIAAARSDFIPPNSRATQSVPIGDLIQKVDRLRESMLMVYETNLKYHTVGECGDLQRLVNSLERLPSSPVSSSIALPNIHRLVEILNHTLKRYNAEEIYNFTQKNTLCTELKEVFDELRRHLHEE